MRPPHILTATLIAAVLSAAVRADTPFLYTNSSNLLPNTPNQVLQIYVSGSNSVVGESLNFQVNTGGSGPIFTYLDILAATIFANDNTGQNIPTQPTASFNSQGIYIAPGSVSGHLAIVSTTATSSAIIANGLLATLHISTTSTTGGSFFLNMINTFNGPSTFLTGGTNSQAIAYPHNQISIANAPLRQWNINGGGSWNSDPNWTSFAPYARGDIANFSNSLTSGTAVITLDAQRTAGTVIFNDTAGTYSLQAGSQGALLLDNGTLSALLDLQGGNHAIAAPIALASNTTASLAANSTLTLSGSVTGSSYALSLVGAGTLLLTSTANNYGATNIAANSSLLVGTAASPGSLGAAAVNNSGQLFLTNVPLPIAIPLGGSGTMTIIGSVIINNTSTAATMIITSAGTLTVGTGGSAGLLDGGLVQNSGLLVFNRSDAVNQLSPISGAGSLTQANTGTTTLVSAASYSGLTTISAGKLVFSGGVSHSIAGVTGSGTLQIDPATALTSDGIYMPAGSLAINGTLTIRSNATTSTAYPNTDPATPLPGTSKVSSLAFASTTSGQLDIKDNGFIVQAANSTSKATLMQLISTQTQTLSNTNSFFNIISSSAATLPTKYTIAVVDNADLNAIQAGGSTSFGGLTVDTNSILLTQALQGDGNLDGSVDLKDFNIWLQHVSLSTYSNAAGDFNGDGHVDLKDYNVWLQHVSNTVDTIGIPSLVSAGSLTGGGGLAEPAGTALGGTNPVPEPAGLFLLGCGVLGLLFRRQRRTSPPLRIFGHSRLDHPLLAANHFLTRFR